MEVAPFRGVNKMFGHLAGTGLQTAGPSWMVEVEVSEENGFNLIKGACKNM